MVQVPRRISKTEFDCTLKAIKVCGSDDSPATTRCQNKYIRRCESNPQSTFNTTLVRNHKNHHTYRTSIVVRHEDDSKRICITESNCNCKTIAKNKCGEDNECVSTVLKQCRERCLDTRRCYKMDCRNAGASRCQEKLQVECAIKFPNSEESRNSCVEKRLDCCLRHEKATCQRALRVYKFRKQCEASTQVKCSGIDNEDERCECVSRNRHSCLVKKVEAYKQSVRDVFDCEFASKIICSEKACGSAYRQCVKQELSVCEPVCVRHCREKCNNQVNGPCYKQEYKTCISKWKRNFCSITAFIKCGKDQECESLKVKKCKRDLPGCMTGDVSCNDNNKCTKDICDPVQGCINQPINCDDNNACTTEFCDPVLGCVYKKKNCDDGVLCTRDTCNTQTGQCVHKFDKSICFTCAGGPCQADNDCNAWSKSQDLASRCREAYCNVNSGSCMSRKIKNCATECRAKCLPYHACDKAECQLNQQSGQFECVHTRKSCDDHKSCTIDTCDKATGCVHTLDVANCPNTPICDTDADCQQWGVQKDFQNKCKKAVCDVKRGVCVSKITSQACDLSACEKACKPKDACETTKCILTDDGASAICKRTPIICDDKKACTVDKCDPVLGQCTFKYTVNDVCHPGCQCQNNADCKEYEQRTNLADQCLKAVCDLSLGACVKVPADKECKIKRKECKDTCVANDACDVAKCVKDGTDNLVCQHTKRSCDDGIECTKDTCDANLGCVHTYTVCAKCPPNAQCKVDTDCLKFGFSQKLGQQCKKAVCDKTLGACVAIPKDRDCLTLEQCTATCQPKNVCEDASCQLNTKGDYYCKRITKNTCDDGDACTFDACEPLTGKCSHIPIDSLACKKTPPPTDNKCPGCKPRHACEEAQCVQSEVGFICSYSDKKCDDGKECTLDSCDKERGCINTYIQSEKCPADAQCKVNDDCANYSKVHKCASKCLVAVCDQTLGRCVTKPSPDTTCAPKEDCKDCKPSNACESAVCVRNPTDQTSTCKRTVNTCNDGKECTKDSCDPTTGKCSNVYTVCAKCPPNAQCSKNLDCKAWAEKLGYDLKCLTPICDDQLGACKVVPNGYRCKDKFCKRACPPRNACEESTCSYDVVSKKLRCEYNRKVCDDKNRCTVDSCDNDKGCQFNFDKTIKGCDTPKCKDKVDCNQYAIDNNLAKNCQDAICDDETKTCRAVLINNKDCNPCLADCKKTCVAANACETAQCVADATSKQCSCVKKAITCDDKNPCTTDVCDQVKGCIFTYTKSETCQEQCKEDNDCVNFGKKHNCSLKCKLAVCDKATTSCKIIDNPDKSCKPVKKECDLICKPRNACETSECRRKKDKPNEFECIYTPISCASSKKCYEGSCDLKKGCQYTFKPKEGVCTKACDKDLDCATVDDQLKLQKKCLKAVCDKESGSCKVVKGEDRPECGDQCQLSADCPQGKFGTVCCVDSGKKKCSDNVCERDSDCKCNKGEWGYCRKGACGNVCSCKPPCKQNEDCNDNNPCTRDVCLKEYGFCKNLPRCIDNSLCTLDICLPSEDNKSYTCKNPPKCCTLNKLFLDADFEKLSPKEKEIWLGRCAHDKGCIDCVVSAQCDDNNGCTKDDCINQRCISTPIDNKWCDPKLEGQAITVQGYFPKFTRL